MTNSLPMKISQEDWLGAKQYVELSTGIKLAYVEMGDPNGQTIILQHGMTDNSRSWSLAAPFFTEAGYHVYLPDLRGMGKSEAPDGFYTPITYATDLKGFFDAMNIDRAILVGHSLGSYTVQSFSIMFPELCEKVVLVSSAPLKNLQNEALLRVFENFIKPLEDGERPADAFMDKWYATILQEEEFRDVFDTFLDGMKNDAKCLPKKNWINIMLGMMSCSLESVYSQVDHSIPVLVLHGDIDNMAKLEYQDELLDVFQVKEDSYRNYANIGHNIHFEIPRKCSQDILAWIDNGKLPIE